jgi:methylene-tetrahydromethanopterin dehydrogenase
MKVLEIKPLKNKTLEVLIVKKEYNEPFWLIEPEPPSTPKMFNTLLRSSIAFTKFLKELLKKVKVDFATEELGMRSEQEFYTDNVLASLFKESNIPFFPVDIDENARTYLATNIDEKKVLRDRILEELAKLSNQKGKNKKPSTKEEYLIAYGQCLQQELEEQQQEINFPVRENWIVMEIMDNARKLNNKEKITCLYICSPEHVNGIKQLLESLDVRVEKLTLSKKIVSTYDETSSSKELEDLLQSMQIQVKPIIKRASEDAPYLLFFLDTDKRASPFDICMAYDSGFDAIIPYDNVTPEDAKNIVHDTIFSRSQKGVKHTCFFIGGKNIEKSEEVLKIVKDTMFPPFEASVIIDPGGAYTTAAATVAKVEDAMLSNNLGSLRDKSCAIFGTGSVGRIIAVLLSRLGCNVKIASINPKRVNGEEYAKNVAKLLGSRYGVDVQGVFASTRAKKVEILQNTDVIFCAATRGVRVIEKNLLKELKLMKIMVDINAVPPFGVEGIKLKDDMREIRPGIFGIGALTIGKLKHALEKEILKEVRSNGKGTYNYNFALQLGRKLLQKKIHPAKFATTLSYPVK